MTAEESGEDIASLGYRTLANATLGLDVVQKAIELIKQLTKGALMAQVTLLAFVPSAFAIEFY